MYHMKQSPTRKLSDALFRGESAIHTFKVYPLTAAITDQPAVFIISRRITDRRGKGHHAAVCIGETESTLSEFRKHKKSKCIKDNASNVVCILRERDPKVREEVLGDLVAGRSFVCVRNVYRPKIDATNKSSIKTKSQTSNAKARPVSTRAKPSRPASARANTTKTATRVSGRVDSDGRQHRLPKPKRSAARKAKARVDRVARPRKKTAA